MTDGFISAMWTLIVILVAYIIWITSIASIIKDCQTVGQFRAAGTVFICKEKAHEEAQ